MTSHFKVTLKGVSPLLMNRFTDEAAEAATTGHGSPFSRSAKKDPRTICENAIYKVDGVIGIPSVNVMRCFIDGGRFVKVGRRNVSTAAESLVPAAVTIRPRHIPMAFDDMPDGWSVDRRPILNQATRGRQLCYRPCFDGWGITFTIELDTELISGSILRELVDGCGKRVGLCDFRPSRKGEFGRFRVDLWEEFDPSVEVVPKRGKKK